MEKAPTGRINVKFNGLTCHNETGEVTIEVQPVIIRDMSPERASALIVRVNEAIIHDAKAQSNS